MYEPIGVLELELIQTQMAQKPMLRAEVYARALRASKNVRESGGIGGRAMRLMSGRGTNRCTTLCRVHDMVCSLYRKAPRRTGNNTL